MDNLLQHHTYSREYNTYRQKIGRQAKGSTELEIEYEKILTRVKKTRESVIRMTDRHYTEPVDEISGTVESASPRGITLKTGSLRPAGNPDNLTRSMLPTETWRHSVTYPASMSALAEIIG
jgi:hypothetical protein